MSDNGETQAEAAQVLDPAQRQIIEAIDRQTAAKLAEVIELKRQSELAEATLKQMQADAQAESEAERKRAIADRNRMGLAINTNETVTAIAPQLLLFIEGFAEWQREDARWKERQDEISRLILTGKGNGNRARIEELKAELQAEHDQQLLVKEIENLQALELQRAQFGLTPPISLINDIKRAEREIEKLQARVGG